MVDDMTIDELIGEAERFASYAVREADRDRVDHDRIMRYTAIAQSCAMTAGAMVQHAWWKDRQADKD